jgi:long-chain acyl-CoA synthetase
VAHTNNIVHAELQRAVDNANKAVSRPESIRRFTVLAGDFTQDNGCLTPSLKLKPNMVTKDYASEAEALYSGPRQRPHRADPVTANSSPPGCLNGGQG